MLLDYIYRQQINKALQSFILSVEYLDETDLERSTRWDVNRVSGQVSARDAPVNGSVSG